MQNDVPSLRLRRFDRARLASRHRLLRADNVRSPSPRLRAFLPRRGRGRRDRLDRLVVARGASSARGKCSAEPDALTRRADRGAGSALSSVIEGQLAAPKVPRAPVEGTSYGSEKEGDDALT